MFEHIYSYVVLIVVIDIEIVSEKIYAVIRAVLEMTSLNFLHG